jgi:hypothetical protein
MKKLIAGGLLLAGIVAPTATAEAAWTKPGKCTYPRSVRAYTEADDYAIDLRTRKVPCFIAAYSFDKWLARPGQLDPGDAGKRFTINHGGARWFVRLICRYSIESLGVGDEEDFYSINCRARRGVNGYSGRNLRDGRVSWVY